MASTFTFLAAIFTVGIASSLGAMWEYSGPHGPSHWKDSYPDCTLNKQSPIDINAMDAKHDSALKNFTMVGYSAPLPGMTITLQNSGHSVGGLLGGMEKNVTVTREGMGTYRAFQFHFHWGSDNSKGSEHTINGMAFPLELHFIHINEKYPNASVAFGHSDGLLVFGTMVKVGSNDSPIFDMLFPLLGEVDDAGDTKSMTNFALQELFPANTSHYFYYPGSLTTPPCSEAIDWHVFAGHLTITNATLVRFRNLRMENSSMPIVNNFRPIQPLNGRVVMKSFPDPKSSSGIMVVCQPLFVVLIAVMTTLVAVSR